MTRSKNVLTPDSMLSHRDVLSLEKHLDDQLQVEGVS